jgi:hypothetical protein
MRVHTYKWYQIPTEYQSDDSSRIGTHFSVLFLYKCLFVVVAHEGKGKGVIVHVTKAYSGIAQLILIFSTRQW